MKAGIGRLVWGLSAVLLAYGAGFMTSYYDWPPSETVKKAYTETKDFALNWRNDLGFEPVRFLVPAQDPERQPTTVTDGARMAPGDRLIAGVSPGKPTLYGIRLLDGAGNERHFWPVRYDKMTKGKTSERNVFQHGTTPLPDGSIVVNFDNGDTIARIGPCGDVQWATSGHFHHSVHRAYDGTLWTWEYVPPNTVADGAADDDHIVQLDAETGQPLRRISLTDDVIRRHALYGTFAIRSDADEHGISYMADPFHPNDVEVLDPAIAAAFPMFEAGDLMISLRSLNLVAVLDGTTLAMKWSRIGPWHRQHDPDFRPDGTISVLNNNMGLGASQVLVVDPKTDAVTTVFDGAGKSDFYTWQRGRHQTLANGNVMVVETERGRAFELTPRGDIVWRYENIFDGRRNGLVNEALVIPEGFFVKDAFESCRPSA